MFCLWITFFLLYSLRFSTDAVEPFGLTVWRQVKAVFGLKTIVASDNWKVSVTSVEQFEFLKAVEDKKFEVDLRYYQLCHCLYKVVSLRGEHLTLQVLV
jgi:hypothetical protein